MGELKHKVLNLISGGAAAEAVPVQPEHHALEPDPARIGVMLRATRVQAGLELRDVATMLKIRHTFMEAIEAGRYHELPGTAYAVGFVRTYADYLGLDGDLAVQRFKDEVAEVISGMECGMEFAGFQDIQQGDYIECFTVEEIKRSL